MKVLWKLPTTIRDYELLLKEMHSLLQAQAISEADIAAEIAAYRSIR